MNIYIIKNYWVIKFLVISVEMNPLGNNCEIV